MIGVKLYKKKTAPIVPPAATKGIRYNPLENLSEIGYLDDIDVIDPIEIDIEGEVISPFYSPQINGLEEIYETLLEFLSLQENISCEIIEEFSALFNDFADDIIADGNEKLLAVVDYLSFASDSLDTSIEWYKTSEKASSNGAKEHYKNLFLQNLNSGVSAIERVLDELGREIVSK